jgi:hypothetical protein
MITNVKQVHEIIQLPVRYLAGDQHIPTDIPSTVSQHIRKYQQFHRNHRAFQIKLFSLHSYTTWILTSTGTVIPY